MATSNFWIWAKWKGWHYGRSYVLKFAMAEFLNLHKRCIAVKKLTENSAKWFPKWFESYVRFHRFHTKESVEKIPVTEDLLIGFLKNLRDSKVPAWQRTKKISDMEKK